MRGNSSDGRLSLQNTHIHLIYLISVSISSDVTWALQQRDPLVLPTQKNKLLSSASVKG